MRATFQVEEIIEIPFNEEGTKASVNITFCYKPRYMGGTSGAEEEYLNSGDISIYVHEMGKGLTNFTKYSCKEYRMNNAEELLEFYLDIDKRSILHKVDIAPRVAKSIRKVKILLEVA